MSVEFILQAHELVLMFIDTNRYEFCIQIACCKFILEFQRNDSKDFLFYQTPSIYAICRYDPLSSCLVDFRGRANIASVKNFQLVESHPAGGAAASSSLRPSTMVPEGEKEFLLQMGKVGC